MILDNVNQNRNNEKIKVGDDVAIVNAGELYSTYYDFFEENDLSLNIAARYAFRGEASTMFKHRVIYIGKHTKDGEDVYVIENKLNKTIYLIGGKGIVKA